MIPNFSFKPQNSPSAFNHLFVLASLDDAEFRNFLGEDGRLSNPEGLRLRIYNGGVAPALRKVIWRLILNIFPENLTGKERIEYIRRKSGKDIVIVLFKPI